MIFLLLITGVSGIAKAVETLFPKTTERKDEQGVE